MATDEQDDTTYVHPDTGEEIDIPDGAVVNRNDDGEITDWTNPPEYEGDDLAPGQVEDYEPHFERGSTTRRVLGFITDDEHLGRSRNTLAVLVEDMADDPNSAVEYGEEQAVGEQLAQLEEAGLVEQRDDGTWAVTEAGQAEVAN